MSHYCLFSAEQPERFLSKAEESFHSIIYSPVILLLIQRESQDCFHGLQITSLDSQNLGLILNYCPILLILLRFSNTLAAFFPLNDSCMLQTMTLFLPVSGNCFFKIPPLSLQVLHNSQLPNKTSLTKLFKIVMAITPYLSWTFPSSKLVECVLIKVSSMTRICSTPELLVHVPSAITKPPDSEDPS